MDEQTIFFTALEKTDPASRAAWLDKACSGDQRLKEHIQGLIRRHEEAQDFLEHPPTSLGGSPVDRATDQDRAASLEAGLAAAFGADDAVIVGSPAHSVLKILGKTIDLPRVVLREESADGIDPIVRPKSSEVPRRDSNSRYQLLGEIARGGMGAILKGRDTDLGRDLAIKVLLDEHRTRPEVIQRFVEEAQIGGQLQHPGIAPIYELGQFADQRPFFSMKLVKGQTLAKLLAERNESAEDRARYLGIFEQVCQTMAYAHSRGVIHRDLKPANVMVGAFGEVQVMDWGLAKVLPAGGVADEKKAQDRSLGPGIVQTLRNGIGSDSAGSFGSIPSLGSHTQIGSVMGTPAYMPPEQALGEIDNLDERADVFGLGAMLCEILTGKPPYVGDNSTQVYRLATRGKLAECHQRLDACGADLDLIQLTRHCLELNPSDRPRDAGALARRVSEYLESVETKLREAEMERAAEAARADAQAKQADAERQRADAEGRRAEAEQQRAETERLRLDQQRQSTRKLRKAMAGLAGVAIVAGMGFVAAVIANMRANDMATVAKNNEATALVSARTAERERTTALQAQEAAAQALVQVEAQKKEAETSLKRAEEAEKEAIDHRRRADLEADVARHNLYFAQMHLAHQAWREHRGIHHMRSLLGNWVPDEKLSFRRQWEWFYLNSLPYQNVRTLPNYGAGSQRSRVAWHAATGRFAEGTADGVIRIWDVDREKITRVIQGPHQGLQWFGRTSLAWSPDGSRLAACGEDRTVGIWDATTGDVQFRAITHDSIVQSVTFNPAGTQVAACGMDGQVKLIDVQTGQVTPGVTHPSGVTAVSWTADGRQVATGNSRGMITWSDLGADSKLDQLQGDIDEVISLAWSPDGRQLAVTTANQFLVQIWDMESKRQVTEPLRHSHGILSIAWSSDGKRLATGSLDETLKIWNLPDGREDLTLRGHLDGIYSVAWGPDDRQIASGGQEGTTKIWDTTNDQESLVLPGGKRMTALAWSHDGQRLATGSDDGLVRIWDPAHPDSTIELKSPEKPEASNHQFGLIHRLAWSSDGQYLAAAGTDGSINVWNVASRDRIPVASTATGPAWSVAWCPDANRLAAGFENGTVELIEIGTSGSSQLKFTAHQSKVFTLAWSPDGSQLASGSYEDPIIRVWNPADGQQLTTLIGHSGGAMGLAWSPDGKQLASSSGDRQVKTWDMVTRQVISTMVGHHDYVNAVAWSPDGSRLASAGFDNTVRIWDPATGAESFVLRGGNGFFHDVSWNPDGARLAAACSDGNAWIWDGTRGYERETTDRALPFIDRAVATGKATGDDLHWYLQSYVRAGKFDAALAATRDDPAELTDLAGILRSHGEAIARDRNLTKALDTLEQKLAAEPGNEEIAMSLADLLLASMPDSWTILRPTKLESALGATLTPQSDGSILASGANVDGDTYRISVTGPNVPIAALRLEVLTDQSLPGSGPGRHLSGNFHLQAIRLLTSPPNVGQPSVPAQFATAWADFDFRAADADIAGVIDDRLKKVWHIWGRCGENHQAIFGLTTPVTTQGQPLTIELQQHHPIGRFRVSVISDLREINRSKMQSMAWSFSDPWTKLAAAYHLAGQEAAYQQMIDRHPDALAGIGQLHASVENWDQALAIYNRQITDETSDVAILINRATAYAGKQQWEAAAADWRRVIALNPRTADWAFASFSGAGRWNEAADFGLELLRHNPANSDNWTQVAAVSALSSDETDYSNLCRLLLAQPTPNGQLAERCIKSCLLKPGIVNITDLPVDQLAVELDNGTMADWLLPYAWACRGLLAYRSGEPELALQHIAQSEAHQPNPAIHALNHSVLALAQHALGRAGDARNSLETASHHFDQIPPAPANQADTEKLIAEILLREAQAKIQ